MTTNKRNASDISTQSTAAEKLKISTRRAVVASSQYAKDEDVTSFELDEYQPSDSGDEAEPNTCRRSDRTTNDPKQRLLDDQVSFIILTRDNNKPSPYGAASTETRPLPWPAVSKLYNAKFGTSVGSAAMEKRARKHRVDWMAACPGYPRDIIYAKNVLIAVPRGATKAPKPTVPCQNQAVGHVAEMISPEDDSDEDDESEDKVTEPSAKVLRFEVARLESECRPLYVGGWIPPDSVREAADINNYIQP
jgi:hypothetical protein